MANDKKQDAIDETFLMQWVTYGLGELDYYMLKVARFEAWCERHPQNEEENPE